MRFEEREILSPRGGHTGCFCWWYEDYRLCDHEHDEGDPICEDARIEMSTIRAETYPDFHRADGNCLCTCGKTYSRHPLSQEYLAWDDRPWLRRLCDGTLVKL